MNQFSPIQLMGGGGGGGGARGVTANSCNIADVV